MDGRTIGRDITNRKRIRPGQTTSYKMSKLSKLGLQEAEIEEFLDWVNSMDSINHTITQGLLLLYKIEKQILRDKANKAKEMFLDTTPKAEKKGIKKAKTIQSNVIEEKTEKPHVSETHVRQFMDLYALDDEIQVVTKKDNELSEKNRGNVIDLNELTELDFKLIRNTFESVTRGK